MENLNLMGYGNWVGVLSIIFIVLSVYFGLTFFQHLKSDDNRLIQQSKLAAVFCLSLALLIPAFYSLYLYYVMMR